MRTSPLFAALAAASTLTLAAQPLAAQQTALNTRTVVAKPTSLTAANPVRILAVYEVLGTPTNSAFPRQITVADSAGALLATVDMAGENSTVPMTVTVIDANLVLQGETSSGLLTLVLDNQNAGGTAKLANGTWTLGRSQGTLRGRTQR